MNLNKRAMNYAKRNNYYSLSKIKKYLLLFDKKVMKLQEELNPSICPECGSINTDIEYSDEEYSCYSYMICEDCWHGYDDTKYMDKYAELESMNYFDSIELEVWAYDFKPPIGYKWFKKCDENMDKMLKELSCKDIV